MQKYGYILGILAALLIAVPATAEQGAAAPEEWGKLGSYGTYYQADAESAFEGEVFAVVKIPLTKSGRSYCMALQVMREGTPCTVYLGPAGFLRRKGMQIQPGDVISVVGSQVVVNGREMVLAREVVRGDDVLKIRQETGERL